MRQIVVASWWTTCIALLLATVPLPTAALNFTHKSVVDFMRGLSPVDAGLYSYAHKCRLRTDPHAHLKRSLNRTFVGQTEAVDVILSAVQRWDEEYVSRVAAVSRQLRPAFLPG